MIWRARAIISYLQDIVVLEFERDRDLLRNNHRILKIFIWDVVELLPVPYRESNARVMEPGMTRMTATQDVHLGITRECPRARGLMSKKEKLVQDVRGPEFRKVRSAGSRFLSFDEFVGRDLSYVCPLM